jgi:hypothetical protein
MLTIDENEFVFTTSILMGPEQLATYSPLEAGGFVFKLQADKLGAPLVSIEENFKCSVDGNVATFSFPFLTSGNTMSGEHTITTAAGLQINTLFAASCVGNFMLVHLHGYRTRRAA